MVVTTGRTLVPGEAQGPLLVLEESVSLWGGVDVGSGEIIEASHPQFGHSISGTILVLPHGRGSSSSSSVLAELLRIGAGPAGIVLDEADSILVVGVLVAETLYGVSCPIIVDQVDGKTGDMWRIAVTGPQIVAS